MIFFLKFFFKSIYFYIKGIGYTTIVIAPELFLTSREKNLKKSATFLENCHI